MPAAAPHRIVILAGATGLVGRELLAGLLADPTVAEIHALVRRPLAMPAALTPAALTPDALTGAQSGALHVDPPAAARLDRLRQLVVDFAALPALPAAHEVYLALGTTIKVAGSQAAFRAVDFDANLAVARAAQAAGARRAALVSAMGANADSSVFYNRVKGELEQALASLGFDALVIARPSLLIGDRAALGQPLRPGERHGERVARWLGPLVPRNYRPITAARVAGALLGELPTAQGLVRRLSGEMNLR
ncbi:MAG: hypothetical protein RIQ60_3769 [Pseudomonadota bacterium]